MYQVYEFIDPICDEVFFVGYTSNPSSAYTWAMKYLGNSGNNPDKDAWLKHIFKVNSKPRMIVIDGLKSKHNAEIQSLWAKHLESKFRDGSPLTNMIHFQRTSDAFLMCALRERNIKSFCQRNPELAISAHFKWSYSDNEYRRMILQANRD